MDVTPYMPIIVEATKFLFDEVGKWIDDVRQRSKKPSTEHIPNTIDNQTSALTKRDFLNLEADSMALKTSINVKLATTDAYEIQGLVNQIQTHRKNLVDLETAEAEFGILTPPYIKRQIEHEASAITEKSARLKSLLEQIYGRRIDSA